MSAEAGATRRRAKEGFAVNGSSEDFLDGMKVQCFRAKSRDCNVWLQDSCCSCISSLSIMQGSKIFLGNTAFESSTKLGDYGIVYKRFQFRLCFHVRFFFGMKLGFKKLSSEIGSGKRFLYFSFFTSA